MIKKYLFGFFAFCVGLISFSSAGVVRPIGIYGSSVYDNSYDLNVISRGSLLTQFIGQTKNVLFLRYGDFFIWDDKGNLYTHLIRNPDDHSSSISEGYFDQVYVCDELNSSSGDPTNCSLAFNNAYNNSLVISYYKDFLKTVGTNDYFYYDDFIYRSYSSVACRGLTLCISSSSVGKSFCWANSVDYGLLDCNNYSIRFPGIQSITGSVGLGDIPFGLLNGYPSPAVDGSSGSSGSTINSVVTGDYKYYDCTYRDVLTWLNTEGYSKYICYGGLDNFDLYDSSINYNPVPGSGLSISQIWAWSGSRAWDNFSQWFSFWNGIYRDSDNNYNAMWESYPAVYKTYFQLYNTYKSTQYGSVVSIDYILNYCQLMDNVNNPNFDLNSSVGGYFKPACESIVREKQTGVWDSRKDGSIYSDGVYTGDVPISVNWDGVGNMSGLDGEKDGLNFIQDFFNLNKTSLYNNYDDLTGIIPGYILVFLFGLILFRFISR